MLGFQVGAAVLLVSTCSAQLFLNSSQVSPTTNASSTSAFSSSTITVAPSLSSSVAFRNTTSYSNGTKNACQASFDSWTTDWWWWVPTTQLEWVKTQTVEWDTTTYSTEIFDCTQTCGTICYAGPVTTIVSKSRISYVETATFGDNPPYSVPRPNCTIGFDDCLSIQSSWSSAVTSYSSMPLEYQVTEIEPPPPACSACISTACTFLGMFGMSLYYWPVTTSVSRDYCASEPIGGHNTAYAPDVNHTYVPTTTGPYAVVNGITMYQGNIYVSYQEPRVRDNCGQLITRQSPGHNVLTIASSDLHSIRKYPHALAPFPVVWDLVPWPVNYDDFNPPTPFSAYAGQRVCAQGGMDTAACTIVKPDEYFPDMMMPPQIRDLDPNWKNCLYDKYAAFDPPIALHTRDNMFSSVNARPTASEDFFPENTPQAEPAPGQSGILGVPGPTPRPGNPNPPEHVSPDQPDWQSLRSQEPPRNRPAPTNAGQPNVPVNSPAPVVTIGPSVIPIGPSGGLVINPGLTISNGGPAATLEGTTVSVGPSGIVLIDPTGASTIPIPADIPSGQQAITVGPSIMPMDPSGGLVLRPGTTLRLGDPATTIDGTVISIVSAGVVLSGSNGVSTVPIPVPQASAGQLITVGSSVYTLLNGELILGPKITISRSGAAVIISGTTVTMASEGVLIISASSTSTVGVEGKDVDAATKEVESSRTFGDARETGGFGNTGAAEATTMSRMHFLPMVAGIIALLILE